MDARRNAMRCWLFLADRLDGTAKCAHM